MSKPSRQGFTIIEILIVITIIGILAIITFLGFGRYQADARDSQRSAKTTILAEALEKFYDKNGEYPGCVAVSDTATTVAANTLPGTDLSTFLTPEGVVGDTNSIECMDITGTADEPDVFAFVGDGTEACNTGPACLQWSLKYKEEATNTIKTVQSRRSTNVATSGIPVITATATGFTQIDTSWTPVNNSLTYDVQVATNATFTADLQTLSVSGAVSSLSVTGLTYNTQYYFRVQAIAANSQGLWSNTDPEATWLLAAPVNTVTTSSATAFTATWGAIAHTAGYTVQCSSNGTTWNEGCSTTTASPSFTFTGANQGTRYYARAQAYNGVYISDWSNIDDTITTIGNPVAHSVSYTNTLAGGWNAMVATSNGNCPAAGTTEVYTWYKNGSGTAWVSGSQYKTVSYNLAWGETMTLSVKTKCTTALATSGDVSASNTVTMSLPTPTTNLAIPGNSTMSWTGVCPQWTTYLHYHYDTNGSLNASGGAEGPGTYSGSPWGNGNAHVTLYCYGPWGGANGVYVTDTTTYGPGCVPTKTLPACFE